MYVYKNLEYIKIQGLVFNFTDFGMEVFKFLKKFFTRLMASHEALLIKMNSRLIAVGFRLLSYIFSEALLLLCAL